MRRFANAMDAYKNEISRQVAWGLGWITKQELCKPKRKKRVIVVSKADANRIHAARWEYFTTGVKRYVTVTPLNRQKLRLFT
jgi:hypothetical protein